MVSPILTTNVHSNLKSVPNLSHENQLDKNNRRFFKSALDKIRSQVYPKTMTFIKQGVDTAIDIISVTSSLNKICLSITKAVSSFFQNSQLVQNITGVLRPILTHINFIQITLAPLHLYNIFHFMYDYFKGEIDLKECLAESFKSLGSFIGSVVTLLYDLAYIGTIPLRFVSKLWPFDIIGIMISAINIILNARKWHNSAKFEKEFLAVFDKNKDISQLCEDDYVKMREFILRQDTQRLKRITDVRGQEIIERITKVCDNALLKDVQGAPKEERIKAKKEFYEAMNTLNGRVKDKIISSKVLVTAASIKLVANTVMFTSAILTMTCPAALVATPFLMGGALAASAASDAISLGSYARDIIKNKKFKNSNLMKL